MLLVAWQIVGNEHSPYFPPPSAWWSGLRTINATGKLWPAIGVTVEAFVLSLIIATVLGAVVGISTGAVRSIDRGLSPTLEFLRSMPPAAVVPVATLLIGYNLQMTLAVVVFASVWPVLLSSYAARMHLDPTLLDVGRTLGLSRGATWRRIVIPSLIPPILVGVRVAAPITLIITLLVEILTSVSGIGALLSTAQQNFDSNQVYGLVAVAGVLALIISVSVMFIEHRVTRYEVRH